VIRGIVMRNRLFLVFALFTIIALGCSVESIPFDPQGSYDLLDANFDVNKVEKLSIYGGNKGLRNNILKPVELRQKKSFFETTSPSKVEQILATLRKHEKKPDSAKPLKSVDRMFHLLFLVKSEGKDNHTIGYIRILEYKDGHTFFKVWGDDSGYFYTENAAEMLRELAGKPSGQ
jgi:hypothetical protein